MKLKAIILGSSLTSALLMSTTHVQAGWAEDYVKCYRQALHLCAPLHPATNESYSACFKRELNDCMNGGTTV